MPETEIHPLTTDQVRAQTKTVTRRFGWWFLQPGDLVQPVLKSMGLRKGEKVQRVGPPIRIVSMRAERLCDITADDVRREGFPEWSTEQFVVMVATWRGCAVDKLCNRIEFEYTDGRDA